MFGTENLLAFVVAGLALNLIPGPDTMYIIARSVSQGRKAGVLSVLGISSGSLCHTFMAAFGLSSLLAASATAFTLVKFAGATYLIYLGIRTLLDSSKLSEDLVGVDETVSGWAVYRQGLLTNLLNPKVSLFFLSFLPQFVDQSQNWGAIPYLFLGLVFIVNGTLWCLLVALCSAYATQVIRNNQRVSLWLRRITGSLFIGLGINLLRSRSTAA
jgi:RhtB (resistance to homoserine/threonine) family protein